MLPALRPALLLVDDDPTLLSVLARRLAREGFDVRTAASGQAALHALERSWPALVVVDLMMPGMDGFELCRRIKRLADLPIIVLSAVDAGEAKVRALEEYAEDYVTKPFNPDELVARVQRVLRRSPSGRGQVTLDGGELEIDLVHRRVSTAAGTQPLTPTEVRLLQVLIGSIDRTVPTDTLLERVWSDADGADPSYVWVTVRRLRRKIELDPDNPRYLLTERGIGYRLISSTFAGSEAGFAQR
ncbi:MAG: response regulator transcription factor [Chloroflexota bacterium]|nr:response regulator transcription factor [Chloroflexota bacterium]